nr:nucleotidyltransferase family protein [Sneathiella limimaris]
MVLAAGLGKRLRPLTDRIPKPLVKVGGKSLIDYSLDLVRNAGIKDVVVNCHYLPEQIEAHVEQISDLNIHISDERAELLETGGGVQKALPFFKGQPFAVLNSDIIVQNRLKTSLKDLIEAWDEQEMDILLLLQPKEAAFGYDGAGDYDLDDEGRLHRPDPGKQAPFIYAGLQIVSPSLFEGVETGAFSMNVMFDKAAERGRLYGAVHDGVWLHVGTEAALQEAEGYLKSSD